MGFTTPCLIYKNTLELQGKLKILGYVEHPTMMNVDISSQFLMCNRGFFAGIPLGYKEEIDNAIDCETNENLFLAIAALRDDTDDSQWFVYPPENIWFICDDDASIMHEKILTIVYRRHGSIVVIRQRWKSL